MCVPLEVRIGADLFDDDSADSLGFGIPPHMVTDIKRFRYPVQLSQSVLGSEPDLNNK